MQAWRFSLVFKRMTYDQDLKSWARKSSLREKRKGNSLLREKCPSYHINKIRVFASSTYDHLVMGEKSGTWFTVKVITRCLAQGILHQHQPQQCNSLQQRAGGGGARVFQVFQLILRVTTGCQHSTANLLISVGRMGYWQA